MSVFFFFALSALLNHLKAHPNGNDRACRLQDPPLAVARGCEIPHMPTLCFRKMPKTVNNQIWQYPRPCAPSLLPTTTSQCQRSSAHSEISLIWPRLKLPRHQPTPHP